jgi:hypothetical protein
MEVLKLLRYLWDKLPVWIKFPLALVMLPIAAVVIILWYSLFLPWQTKEITANIMRFEELRNREMVYLVEKQNLINTQMGDSIKRIEQHQGIMMRHILSIKKE